MQVPQVVDVLICGAGPAGLMASLCLTTYGFKLLHIDDRDEPTKAGRADGIQPRTIEVSFTLFKIILDLTRKLGPEKYRSRD
jgi:2-polyprenyl-6-methoxyphenol hydroxylase-like FAD-dependent oxidoreductase